MSNSLTATSAASVASSATARVRKAKGSSVASKLPHQVLRRNERERKRVQQVNLGFISLRDRVPQTSTSKKLSKVETLREAARYIRHLQELLQMPVNDGSGHSMQAPSETSKYSPKSYCRTVSSNSAQTYQQQQPVYDRQQYYLSYNSSGSVYSSPTYSNSSFPQIKKEDISPSSSCNSEISVDDFCYLPKNYIL